MRILALTFYYRPDLSAGSFRTTALVTSLLEQAPQGSTIHVITTLPNRYHSFSADAPEREASPQVTIDRIALPAHKSGMADQSKAFLTFAREAVRRLDGPYDVVFATSSRLMTAVLGSFIARKTGAKLYLDIRDIFVDTIKDVLNPRIAFVAQPFFSLVEQWAVSKASTVNLVSRGFASYFEPRYPGTRFTYFTNGIDDEFVEAGRQARGGALRDRPRTVLYAGNLGEGQGLHRIVPELARRLGPDVRFQVLGEGGRRRALEEELAAAGVVNVELLSPVPRAELLARYQAADVLFLHLNDYDAFKRVLPSKIFEYAAMGKPLWAGVAGYAAEFIRAEVSNAAVFPPCDADAAMASLRQLRIENTPRPEFMARHARTSISSLMAADIVAVR